MIISENVKVLIEETLLVQEAIKYLLTTTNESLIFRVLKLMKLVH